MLGAELVSSKSFVFRCLAYDFVLSAPTDTRFTRTFVKDPEFDDFGSMRESIQIIKEDLQYKLRSYKKFLYVEEIIEIYKTKHLLVVSPTYLGEVLVHSFDQGLFLNELDEPDPALTVSILQQHKNTVKLLSKDFIDFVNSANYPEIIPLKQEMIQCALTYGKDPTGAIKVS